MRNGNGVSMKLMSIYKLLLESDKNTFIDKFKSDPELYDKVMASLKDAVKLTKDRATDAGDDIDEFGKWYVVKHFIERFIQDGAAGMSRADINELMREFSAGMNIGEYRRGAKIGESSSLRGKFEAIGDFTLFRSVTMENYEDIQRRGYITTDCRGCIVPDEEGINLSDSPTTAFGYIPPGQPGVVLAIDPTGLELFMIGADHYIRTAVGIHKDYIIKVSDPVMRYASGRFGAYDSDRVNDLYTAYVKHKDDPYYEYFTNAIESNL